jgi:digeranylgeranylglycerophospholipid reductase
MTIECDVLVVGAGPAGCAAARACSKKGFKTVLVDKKEQVGVPVRCGEGVGSYLINYLPFKIPQKYLEWKIEGMSFYVEDILIERFGNFWGGYSVDRRKFDRWLADEAIRVGTKLLMNYELVDLQLEQNNARAYFESPQGETRIVARHVIAADGVDSSISKILGLYNKETVKIANVYSWEIKNIELYNPSMEQVFLGDYAPSGYAYIFPKSRDTANVGVGGFSSKSKLKEYFDEFLELPVVKKQIKKCRFSIEKSGMAPVEVSQILGYKNVFFCGDAANQNIKPFIEGILPAIICGDTAGNSVTDGYKKYKENLEFIFGIFEKESERQKETLFKILKLDNRRRYLSLALVASGISPINNVDKLVKLDAESLRRLLYLGKNKKWRFSEFCWYKYIEVGGIIRRLITNLSY